MTATMDAAPDRDSAWADPVAVVLWFLGAMVVVLVVVPLVVIDLRIGLALLFSVLLFGVVVVEPVNAAYAFLLLTPLSAGFERGSVLPVIRPSEALLVLILAAVATRSLADGLHGELPGYEVTRLDVAILAMAVFSSIVPLFWRVARGFRPTSDDLMFATTLWKYLLVFALFRLVVDTPKAVQRCLFAMAAAGSVVAVIAILQSLDLAGVPVLIARIYQEPLDTVANNRGSSTLGTSHGVADVMAFNLALAVACIRKGVGRRSVWMGATALFGLACFASGQFSAMFAILVAVIALGVLGGRFWKTVRVAIPSIAVSLALLRPVIEARFAHTNDSGVPSSWDARRFNLTNYFWPELTRSGNWILGVRPAGRLPSYEPWREWVYIESGHTWLLWTGGVPLFMAFMWFSWTAAHASRDLARFDGIAGALGVTAAVAFWVVFVLMLLDVHLTMRGPADALFPLLALVCVPAVWSGRDDARLARLGRRP